MATPTSPVIDPEKLKQLLAGGPSVPMIAPPLGGGSTSPQLPALDFKQRQALPTTSAGVAPGSSEYYQNKLSRLEDQQANPLGSAENHPGMLGKIGHTLGAIGNKALDVTGINTIPGTEANRLARISYDQAAIPKAQEVELGQKREAANETYQQGELADRAAGRKNEADRLELEANKQTPEQESLQDLQNRINPATDKNYTAEEAEIKRAQDIQDTKPDTTKAEAPHTITMTGPDNKPYEYQYDPKGNYTDPSQGYGQWKKIGPGKPEANGGIIGSLQPLFDPQTNQMIGTFNTKTAERKLLPPIGAGAPGGGENPLAHANTGTMQRLGNTERNQFNAQVIQPSREIETNFQKATAAVDAYNQNPQTGAAGMVLFAQHLGTTLGGIKGAAIGEHSQELHADAIGLSDRISRWVDQNMTGQPLSQSQVRDFYKMIGETRDITWRLATAEAARRHQPIDFLPGDVQIQMKDGSGKTRKVAGNQVQGYLDKGAELAE